MCAICFADLDREGRVCSACFWDFYHWENEHRLWFNQIVMLFGDGEVIFYNP